jgi:hypothetical protein
MARGDPQNLGEDLAVGDLRERLLEKRRHQLAHVVGRDVDVDGTGRGAELEECRHEASVVAFEENRPATRRAARCEWSEPAHP